MVKFCFIHAAPDAEVDSFLIQDLAEEKRVHRCWITLSPPLLKRISTRPVSPVQKLFIHQQFSGQAAVHE